MLSKLFLTTICLSLLVFSNCTAANIWNIYNNTNNTNPTPEYNNYNFLFIRGGFLFHMNKMPGGIGNNVKARSSGTTCSHSVMYIASMGDSSLESAMAEAKIQKIAYVSYEQFAILAFLYHRFCTTVAGE